MDWIGLKEKRRSLCWRCGAGDDDRRSQRRGKGGVDEWTAPKYQLLTVVEDNVSRVLKEYAYSSDEVLLS